MAGLWNFDLEGQTTNPLFLGGAALLSGEGMGGAMRGMQLGSQFSQQRRKQAEEEAQKAQWQQYAQGGMGGLTPEMQALVRAVGPQQGAQVASQYMMKQPELAMERERLAIAKQAEGRQAAMSAAQLQQLKMQTPEWRQANAGKFGIDPNTPEGRSFVISGSYSPKDEMSGLVAGLMRGAIGQPAPSQQPQQQPPTLQRQSFEGGADPNLIPVQTAPPTQPQGQPTGSMFDGKSAAEKRRMGEALLLDPRTKGLGEQLIKDAEKGAMGTAGQNELDKEIIAKATDVADLNNIRQAFKPEFLGLEGKAKSTLLDWQDWISSKSVDANDKRWLADYTKMATSTTERLNNRIKALSGAAVSAAEEKRMYAANPTMKDGPTTFKSKLDEQIDMQRMAIARFNWLKNQYRGTAQDISALAQSGRIEAFPLGDMKQRINDELDRKAQELRQQMPDMNEGQLRQQLKMHRNRTFGI